MATSMSTISGIAASRVPTPSTNSAPQTNSVVATNGALISGIGIPIRASSPVPLQIRELALPREDKLSPTDTRASNIGSQALRSSSTTKDW